MNRGCAASQTTLAWTRCSGTAMVLPAASAEESNHCRRLIVSYTADNVNDRTELTDIQPRQ